MSRNISVNKKLGGSQTPFINANVAADALAMPGYSKRIRGYCTDRETNLSPHGYGKKQN